jgi:hypothetical protein
MAITTDSGSCDAWSIELDDVLWELSDDLAHIAEIQGELRRAAALCGAAAPLLEAVSTDIRADDRRRYEQTIADVRARLDDAAFAAAWAEGRHMTLDEAAAFALDPSG